MTGDMHSTILQAGSRVCVCGLPDDDPCHDGSDEDACECPACDGLGDCGRCSGEGCDHCQSDMGTCPECAGTGLRGGEDA